MKTYLINILPPKSNTKPTSPDITTASSGDLEW